MHVRTPDCRDSTILGLSEACLEIVQGQVRDRVLQVVQVHDVGFWIAQCRIAKEIAGRKNSIARGSVALLDSGGDTMPRYRLGTRWRQ